MYPHASSLVAIDLPETREDNKHRLDYTVKVVAPMSDGARVVQLEGFWVDQGAIVERIDAAGTKSKVICTETKSLGC